jgi:hypothetical protein
MIPAEFVVLVRIIIAQYFTFIWMVVLESVEPPTGVVLIPYSKNSDSTARNRTIQLGWVILWHSNA